jgi:phosphate:Na+ symporter
MFIQSIGGLGLFLLGMIIMTSGLRNLAGESMRGLLMRFTNNPWSGALTGTCSTAILQSSSATTVAAVGFVSAGLLTYSQALGIIFGANLGTTITGWMVVLIGFKLQLGSLLLPLILLGALLNLFANKRLANVGMALAGFALIFVGIDFLQEGLSGFQNIINPERLPQDSLFGRLQLVLLGLIITTITQSSSAGVATALAALYAGNINFYQAAALVIGMDIGTTLTAVFSTIGGTIPARRTGFSHCIYNVFTAIGALLLLSPFVLSWEALFSSPINTNAEIALVAFHSLFNFLGVIIVLPFSHHFASFMCRLIPEEKSTFGDTLDDQLLQSPELALSTLQKNNTQQFLALLHYLSNLLDNKQSTRTIDLQKLKLALNESSTFADKLHLEPKQELHWQQLLALIHALDHLHRLHERCEEEDNRARTASTAKELKTQYQLLLTTVNELVSLLKAQDWLKASEITRQTYKQIHEQYEHQRTSIIKSTASGSLTVTETTALAQSLRWMDRVSWHLARISHHYMRSFTSDADTTIQPGL